MPGLLSLLLVSLSVGLSNFAGAIGIGLSGIDAKTRIRVGLAFGFFEALMPLIGLLIGQAAAGFIGRHLTGYVAGGILILTGAYTIFQGWGLDRKVDGKEERPGRSLQTHSLIVTAMALSIDNLAVGFALAVYHIQIVLAALTMGVVSVAMSLAGLELGHRLGRRVEGWSEEIGGAILILVGIAIAFGLLG
ncbi:MAG TPA: manganese efflux pump [Candidatus Dormibacteraeota bacterium]|nr:manganese efflux pump [Candidatus Dormibacteraeota bacterium]